MLIRFWCDSEITFSRGLHKNLMTVLYFSKIIVLCGAGGDASFAPQANLVCNFNITFLATWGCASDFLEMLPKFKMAARGQL